MRSVIVAWCKSNAQKFEQAVPLHFVGKRNQRLNFSSNLDVLFIEGFERLDDDYKANLAESGYTLHNASSIYAELEQPFQALNQFGDYEKKCFLRWLVIARYFAKEKIIHYDGDVVFNDSPDRLAELLNGKTFILQGCPALTVITQPDWFDQYHHHLTQFSNNIATYSAQAWEHRITSEDAHARWLGHRDRPIISSDQDLFRHLLYTQQIYQDDLPQILRGLEHYILFENPLYLDAYHLHSNSFRYERRNGIDFLGSQQVMIWHMQSTFSAYLCDFIFRKQHLPWKTGQLQQQGFESKIRELGQKYLRFKPLSRLDVYQYFFDQSDFRELFTEKHWWRPNVFSRTVQPLEGKML
jgi:hypothetical protein